MSKNILGIDLGTSSVKLLLYSDGEIVKTSSKYDEKTPKGFLNAIKKAIKNLDITSIDAIGLSSQVGTYIINEKDIIGWDRPIGRKELDAIKAKYSKETFIKEIAMPHPDIISYPIPRLMYIKENFENIFSICQPKDYLIKTLTGNMVTDKFSFRGLIHTTKGEYSDFFLNEIGIDKNVLPKILLPEDVAGYTTKDGEKLTGIPEGIPVYTGLNDFFASLLGMGISKENDMFDITGTSEHIGIIQNKLDEDTPLVSGVYINDFIKYGVTASSGASLDFGIREFGLEDLSLEEALKNNPPIFAPYVNGERAPIFDADARGVFFGINSKCTKKDMAYSVLEGVAFSIYHIYQNMNISGGGAIYLSGGSSKNDLLNNIKAELFNKTFLTLSENDTSALGAVKVAANALGLDTQNFNTIVKEFKPSGKYHEILTKRFNIYKNLYSSLKNEFKSFNNIERI